MKYIDEAFKTQVVSTLSGTAVGEKVFGAHLEQTDLPAVNFYHIATLDLPGDVLDGSDGLARIIIEVACICATKVEARDIMNLIMDDWKAKSGGQNSRTIGAGDKTVDVRASRITTRQMVFDSVRKAYHGVVDVMIVYRED